MKKYLLLLLLAATLPLHAHDSLRIQLQRFVSQCDARVGIALILDGTDTLTFNNDFRYPLMSVMKYHQALAVAHCLEQAGLPLSTTIQVDKSMLRPDTYSPLREKYPDGHAALSLDTLLLYTLQQSDNNACDILFDYIGGVAVANRYLHTLGVGDFSLSATEADMHRDLRKCYDNWSSPLSAARLMDRLVDGSLPIDTAYTRFIRNALLGCQTGQGRLPYPLLGHEVRIGHKTGTSGRNASGEWIAVNDVGFVLLPGGHRYTVAVMVMHSRLGMGETEQIIAHVSQLIYRAVTGCLQSRKYE